MQYAVVLRKANFLQTVKLEFVYCVGHLDLQYLICSKLITVKQFYFITLIRVLFVTVESSYN